MGPVVFSLEVVKNAIFQTSFIYILAAGFALIYRATGVFHIAYAIPFLVGAYVAHFLISTVNAPGVLGQMGGVVAAVGVGFLIDRTVYAYLDARRASGSLRLVASLGVTLIGVGVVSLVCGNQTYMVFSEGSRVWDIGGLIVTSTDVSYFLLAAMTAMLLYWLVSKSRVGLKLRASLDNPPLASVLGQGTWELRAIAVALGSALGGLGGVMQVVRNGVEPASGLPVAILAAVATVVGGKSLLVGPLLGASILGFARTLTTQLFSDRWLDTVSYLILLVLVWRNPRGVLAPSIGAEKE